MRGVWFGILLLSNVRILSQRSSEVGGPSGCRVTPLVQLSNRRRLYHESCSHVLVELVLHWVSVIHSSIVDFEFIDEKFSEN